MILSAIVAISKNRVIGKKNRLPWNIPEDLQYFRDTTMSRVMIMGRKTFESLGSPLPGRFHIVITRNQAYDYKDPMVEVVASMNQALELAHKLVDKYHRRFGNEVFVIGGADVYAQSLDLLHRLYLTQIDAEFEGDTHFPAFDEGSFKVVSKIDRPGPPPYSFLIYEKKQ